ncbi:uncharacterized protein LOC121417143 [Lytechinus variegatus]|uniref:uncharacterized protein LOC121417143 n=1 Tax=Lytechinus variegatus TaxID=7654 RepID=UPI001BB10CAE|nr:uncharacterized protein LOC121417143 [Lytechinus variegatus]XP_041466666.1 uncharacterized protein LOC121417143 [Lytechinus variegatus]XP_041466667.1 uncharacterized protein LOC121417143 [Lytechinus variegatus]
MMSQPTKDMEQASQGQAQPGPGGDTDQRTEIVLDPKAERDSKQEQDAEHEKEDPPSPGVLQEKHSNDEGIENDDHAGVSEGDKHHQVHVGALDVERGTSAAPEDEANNADQVPDRGEKNETNSNSLTEQDEHTVSETREIDSDKNDNIKALLGRDLHHLTRPERSILYREGARCQEEGHMEGALKCYLGAITGLAEGSSFEELPKCLHAIADVYFEKKEYEKAVYFIQAEKMYYETALIDIVCVPKDTDSKAENRQNIEDGDGEHQNQQHIQGSDEETSNEKNGDPDDDLSPDAKKGQEFENLARLCLREGKLQLALDYCGKATKMYQTEYGEDHPITVAALDLFTVIYADVGKKLYSDAMQKFEKEEEVLKSERSHDVSPDNNEPELRQRFTSADDKEVNGVDRTMDEGIHQGELEPTSLEDRDDWVMTVLLMLIFFLVTVFIVIVISSIYCYNNNRTGYCAQTRGDINYWYMYGRQVIHNIRKSFR